MAKKDWKPKSTCVVILGLGLSDWADPDDPSWRRHETLAEFFKKAGVPEEQVMFWEDEEGTPEAMRENLPAFLSEAPEDSLFIFYYCGHGYRDEEDEEFYFCHPDTEDAISGTELFDMIEESFGGSQAVLLADCCFSGSLARAVEEREADVAYAALTSATSDIESTGNWTFTDCVLSGLRGEHGLDANGDGAVSFEELCEHVVSRMKEVEEQPADYAHSEHFDPSFRLAVVKGLARARAKEPAEAE